MNKPFELNLQLFGAESLTDPRDNLPNGMSGVTAREVDFVTRFDDNWQALRDILGIMRPIRKTPGTTLKSYNATVTLANNQAAPGAIIPYSKSDITPVSKEDLSLELYSTGVTIQDVEKYGAAIAVEKTDDAFLTALQNKVLNAFYTFLQTGSLTDNAASWKAALARAQGLVLNKFMTIKKQVTEVVGFANVLDAYDYLGDADITTQNAFGLTYLKDFMGYNTLILLPAQYIPRNKVFATPVENIDLYYIDPGDGDFEKMGLTYTVKGETNLIGFHAQGNYQTAVGEVYAIMGMALWAEYLDGIANITITGVLPVITVNSAAGSASGKTKITTDYTLGTGESYVYKVTDDEVVVRKGDSTASGWTSWDGSADITAATGKIITIAVSKSSAVIAAGHATVTAKA